MIKSSQETENIEECSQVDKEHLQKLAANILLKVEALNASSLRREQGNGVHFHHPYQNKTESSSQCHKARKKNQRHTDWRGLDKTVPICKWHDGLHRKSQGICKTLEKINSVQLQEIRSIHNIIPISIY